MTDDAEHHDPSRDALDAALERAARETGSTPAPALPLDAVVTVAEINERHGTGILLQTVLGPGDDVVAIRTRIVYGGEERFGRRRVLLNHQGRSRAGAYAATLAAVEGIEVRRILCVPFDADEAQTAIALHDAFDAPLVTSIMDDQNIHEHRIGDALMRELLEKSRLRLAISRELEAAYEAKFGLPVHYGPPLVPERLIRADPGTAPAAALASRRGFLVGNVWAVRWFDMLLEMIKNSGQELSWSCPTGVRANGKVLSASELAKSGVQALGALPEREFVSALRAAPFVVVTSGTLDERDEHPAVSRLSLPSRIVFVLAVAQTPILVLGHPDTAAAQFVTRHGVGLVAPYEPLAYARAVEEILQPEAQHRMQSRAATLGVRFTAEGARDWLWGSLSCGRPVDGRFEELDAGGGA